MAWDAWDRPDDDFEPGDVRSEQRLRHGGPDAAAPAPRSGPAGPRSREECYEALRAADRSPADGRGAAPDSERSGWDSVDAGDRPRWDAIQVSPERSTHILDGDSRGGGHRHGVGRPRKTEFPASWDDSKIMGNVVDVARRPDAPPVLQHRNDRWVCTGPVTA